MESPTIESMTKERAEEIIEYLNGSLVVQFESYYKYTFIFAGENDRYKIAVSLGGNSDDIYRTEVRAENNYKIPETWDKIKEQYNWIMVEDKETRNGYSESF